MRVSVFALHQRRSVLPNCYVRITSLTEFGIAIDDRPVTTDVASETRADFSRIGGTKKNTTLKYPSNQINNGLTTPVLFR